MNNYNYIEKQKEILKENYKNDLGRRRFFLFTLVPVVVLAACLAVALGSADISPTDVLHSVFTHAGFFSAGNYSSVDIIIWKLRIPRIAMGVLAGGALGIAGAVMQVILKNPLADPYMLGISSAASFGASLAIVTGIGIFGGASVVANAFVFSVSASFLILLFSSRRGASPDKMVLTGLALLFFFQAMTTLIQYFGDSDAVKAALFWTVGDLGKADLVKVAITMPVVLLGSVILIFKAKDLNIINTGDASAKSLGVNVGLTRVLTMVVCSVIVATVVSFSGTIGFVGLVAPHLVRLVSGSDNRVLLPASALIGALLLVISDTVARTILSPVILPVGTVTSFLGVPLFLYLIIRKKGSAL